MDAVTWKSYPLTTDGEIERALLHIMQAYETRLYNFLLTLTHDADVAADCLQETFIRTYDLLKRGRTCNAQWLYTVARSRAITEFRRKRRLAPDDSLEHASQTVPFDDRLAVEEVMDRLPEDYREILYLYDVSGWTTAEIGEIVGLAPAAVRQRLSRARKRFRELYQNS